MEGDNTRREGKRKSPWTHGGERTVMEAGENMAERQTRTSNSGLERRAETTESWRENANWMRGGERWTVKTVAEIHLWDTRKQRALYGEFRKRKRSNGVARGFKTEET